MRPPLKVQATKRFRKDYEKLLQRYPKVRSEVEGLIDLIARRQPLPEKYRDHSLKGNLSGFRDCHVRGDIVLLYRIEEDEVVLLLVRIGSHSELGL